jgi:hypothetical protein
VFDTFKYGIRYYRYFVWCVWNLQMWHTLLPVFCVVCLTPSNIASITTGILCDVFDTFKYGIRYYQYFVWCVWHLQIWHPLLPVFCVVCLSPSNMASVTTGILCCVFDTFKYGIRYYQYFVWCVWYLQIWHPLLPVFCVVFCRWLFILLSFLFWPLHCLSLDLRLLITTLVSFLYLRAFLNKKLF